MRSEAIEVGRQDDFRRRRRYSEIGEALGARRDDVVGRRPPRRGARADVERWAGLMPRRGACAHPDGTVRFVNSALRVFAAELTAHERGHCTGSSTRAVLPTPQTADRGWK